MLRRLLHRHQRRLDGARGRGNGDRPKRIANEVRVICEESLAKCGSDSPESYWLQATAAEAALVSGDMDSARLNYTRATTDSNPGAAEVSRTRSQARFLLKFQEQDEHALDDCFVLPRIGLFTGHMLDRRTGRLRGFPQRSRRLSATKLRHALSGGISRLATVHSPAEATYCLQNPSSSAAAKCISFCRSTSRRSLSTASISNRDGAGGAVPSRTR